MYSIDSDGSVSGLWSNGDPSIPTPATVLDAVWMNAVQAELLAILAAASITPVKGTNNQVLAAINALLAKTPSPTAPSYGSNWSAGAGGAQNLGAYRTADGHYVCEGQANTSVSRAAGTQTIGTVSLHPSVQLYGTVSIPNSLANGGGVFPCFVDTSGNISMYLPASVTTVSANSNVYVSIHGLA